MCDFRVLAQNTDGYVVYCPDCVAIQLAFGTAMIKLRVPHFEEVARNVYFEASHRTPPEHANLKNITIPLDEGMMLCLTFHELLKLEQLLNEASSLFETYRILEHI